MRNQSNQILDRVQCALPPMKAREETLEFHYLTREEFHLEDDDIFVIYPQNYGKKFNQEATFLFTFEKPYFADIQLLTLPYDCIVGGGLQYVAQFESTNHATVYACKVDCLKERNIYLVSIRHRPY